MTAANTQNRICAVEAFIRWMPKLSTNMKTSGENITT